MPTSVTPSRPNKNSYRVLNTRLFAGEYPGTTPSNGVANLEARLTRFLDAGINVFIDLTDPKDGLAPYAPALQALARDRGIQVHHEQFTIRDMGICGADYMNRVLDAIDRNLEAGHSVYVHCWGGIGRTGMVVGCWLVRGGSSGTEALNTVVGHFATTDKVLRGRYDRHDSPQTEPQREVVRNWAAHDRGRADQQSRQVSAVADVTLGKDHSANVWTLLQPNAGSSPAIRDRMRGALIGLAVGDAVGTTVEFKTPGAFAPVTDMTGGGPFGLKPGEWTDDTSMALCLAESLIECRELDPQDQMERYLRWRDHGHLSSNGRCFDIGSTVGWALRAFETSADPYSGPTGERTAGNGSLMRLAPVPIFFFAIRNEPLDALAANSSRTTHGTPVAVDACRYLATLVGLAIGGAGKEELTGASREARKMESEEPLHPVIAEIAAGSFRDRKPPEILGDGYAANSLEAALWAFHNSSNFREGCLMAVNLGYDADTTAAVYGQLAGAFYGESGIPAEWRDKLARKPLLDHYAEALFQLAFDRRPLSAERRIRAASDAREMIAAAGGDPALAIARFLEGQEREKAERGIFAYHMGGSMAAGAMRDEILITLRITLGASVGVIRGV